MLVPAAISAHVMATMALVNTVGRTPPDGQPIDAWAATRDELDEVALKKEGTGVGPPPHHHQPYTSTHTCACVCTMLHTRAHTHTIAHTQAHACMRAAACIHMHAHVYARRFSTRIRWCTALCRAYAASSKVV